MADFREQAAAKAPGKITPDEGVAGERRSFDDYHEHVDEAQLIGCLRAVRDQLADAGRKAYSALIRLIDSSTGDSQAESDDLMGAARAALEGAKYVNGGAIEDLRELMVEDRS